MNYHDPVSNKGPIKINSGLLKEKKNEVASFAGDSNHKFKAQDTEIKLDISKLLSIEQSQFREKDICGISDTRYRVLDTKIYPYSAICWLIITDANGGIGVGSGWLNGNGTVITAGHNVFDHNLRKWNKEIIVVPGKNGRIASGIPPFGTFTVTQDKFRSVRGWTENLDKEYDYGALILSEKVGKRTGYFGYKVGDSSILDNPIRIAGYPSDKIGDEVATQWYSLGYIHPPLYNRKIAYKLYTVEGDSGAPVWIDNTEYQAIGIHVHGGCPHEAIRITQDVFDNLERWRNEGQA
ncbi:hypothetical protein BG07_5696 (plasmid) [Bacillus pseudomycoides]|uniref:trypsin-like serine peptidase n=1 Tax=Bacillus pseudomycoides TaxID=64104 RepID=UPI0004ED7D88|nr:hypothetical protein [Bacillus pseudomycoides]AIK35264.1 hypothetical protein DJ92_5771 [Bacillus pseudomycoides]AJI14476.1 hypothetical protein BG07_5696 [Bacillus pseudomycoides]